MHGTMEHGTIKLRQRPIRSQTASIFWRAAIVVASIALLVTTAIIAEALADRTEAGRAWLIKYGFEYPADCGG